jgi:hypothetical protein
MAKYLGGENGLNMAGRMAVGTVTGGVSSAMAGGDFVEGAIQGAWTSAIAHIVNENGKKLEAQVRRWMAEFGNNGYAKTGAAASSLRQSSASSQARSAAAQKALIEAFKPDPKAAHNAAQWWIEASGINEWQSSFYEAALITAVAEGALLIYAAPELYIFSGTPQGQAFMYKFVPSMFPTELPDASRIGLAGTLAGKILGIE